MTPNAKCLLATSFLMMLGTPRVPAQSGYIPIPGHLQLDFPNGSVGDVYRTLKKRTTNNTYGYPEPAAGNEDQATFWPTSVTIGDIDNDGQDDFLYCIEQRLLLAVGMTRNQYDVPDGYYPIWVFLDENGTMYKHDWQVDVPVIGDFDGDGDNEVAAVIGSDTSDPPYYEMVIFEEASSTVDARFSGSGAVVPIVGASVPLSSLQNNWSQSLRGQNAANMRMIIAHTLGRPGADDIVVYDGNEGRPALMAYDEQAGTLTSHYAQAYNGLGAHYLKVEDLDSDGSDEILCNGIIKRIPQGSENEWLVTSLSAFSSCPDTNNHADAVTPFVDYNSDGIKDLVISHSCYDLIVSGDPSAASPTLLFENNQANDAFTEVVQHGQHAIVGELIPGIDTFGIDNLEYIALPKGAPIYNDNNLWGSVVINAAGNELALNVNNIPNYTFSGPDGWDCKLIEWDGDTSSAEVVSNHGVDIFVWKLIVAGPGSDYEYEWLPLDAFTSQVNGYFFIPHDVYGNSREEVCIFGRRGVEFRNNL